MNTASKPEDHDTGPKQKTYNFPAFDRKKLYDAMQKRLTTVSSCCDRVQIIHEYWEKQGVFKDIRAPILTEVVLIKIMKVKASCLVMTRSGNVDLIEVNIEKH